MAGCANTRPVPEQPAMRANNSTDERSTERQPATRNELAGAPTEKTLKRARWEHLRLAACPGARRVNVANYSYGVAAVRTGEHTYTVTLAPDGQPTDCTCPAAEYQPGPCKHAVAVADAPDVIADAMHGDSDPEPSSGADAARVAADGGQPATEDYVDLGALYERTGERPDDCRCADQLSDDVVCTRCSAREFATPNPEVR